MTSYFNSPIGWLEINSSGKTLDAIRFLDTEPEVADNTANSFNRKVIKQLTEYFNRERTNFSIPVNPEGTDFQKMVWSKLQDIPFGQTVTYGQLAKKLGDSNKVRAVGKANGQNPIPVIIPCHRVIGANNKLVGYAGGISRKKFLLQHEGALLL